MVVDQAVADAARKAAVTNPNFTVNAPIHPRVGVFTVCPILQDSARGNFGPIDPQKANSQARIASNPLCGSSELLYIEDR